MFYKFVGKYKAHNFELSKVIFLNNTKLEQDFEKRYKQMKLENVQIISSSGALARLLSRQLSNERLTQVLSAVKNEEQAHVSLQIFFIRIIEDIKSELGFIMTKSDERTFSLLQSY